MATKLKFPILKKVDYLDLVQNKITVLQLTTKDCEGITWRDLQKLIGKKVGAGKYFYNLKFQNDNTINKGLIKAVTDGILPKPKSEDAGLIEVKTMMEALTKKIDNAGSGGGVSVELLMSVQKTQYENTIKFLENNLADKKAEYLALKVDYNDKCAELQDTESQLQELEKDSGLMKYLPMVQDYFKDKMGTTKPITNLKDSNQGDIPPDILQLLGMVDWANVDQEVIGNIVRYMNIAIQKLPMKGAPNA